MMGSRLAVRPLDVTLSVGLMGCVIWSGFDRMKHGRIEGAGVEIAGGGGWKMAGGRRETIC